jgi:hypothetical protein
VPAAPPDPLWLPSPIFGGATEPTPRVGLRIARGDAFWSLAGGAVDNAATFERTAAGLLVPAEGGLFGEDTFGPLPRTARGDVELAALVANRLTQRAQLRRAGAITLGATVLHPWLSRFRPEVVDMATGLARPQWRAVLAGTAAMTPEGTIREVATAADGSAEDWRFGRDALLGLARERGRTTDVVGLPGVPVIAPAHRPPSFEAGALVHHSLTQLYVHLLSVDDAARAALEDGPSVGTAGRAHAQLQAAVEALFLDGLTGGKVRPLAAPLLGRFGALAIDDLSRVSDAAELVRLLRGTLYAFRALVEASALEIVPLLADGSVDQTSYTRGLTDRLAGQFDDVYREQLGACWDDVVLHIDEAALHVDVYPFRPAALDGRGLLLTAGLSAHPTPQAILEGDPFIELGCVVPVELELPARTELMRMLWLLAQYPTKHATFLDAGHDVPAGRPLITGSRLEAFTFERWETPWLERLSLALPRIPTFLRAIGLTKEELAFKREHGFAALRARMQSAGTWDVTDPRRV